jgi:hypothetical protein
MIKGSGAGSDAGLMCPRPMCPRPKILGCCAPWTKRPLDIVSLTDVSRSVPRITGSGSGRPKNLRIRLRIRICSTGLSGKNMKIFTYLSEQRIRAQHKALERKEAQFFYLSLFHKSGPPKPQTHNFEAFRIRLRARRIVHECAVLFCDERQSVMRRDIFALKIIKTYG